MNLFIEMRLGFKKGLLLRKLDRGFDEFLNSQLSGLEAKGDEVDRWLSLD